MSTTIRTTDDGFEFASSITLSWRIIGEAFARADEDGQRLFLSGMVSAVDDDTKFGRGRWAMQCCSIANNTRMSSLSRQRVAALLECLVEHLAEPEGK